MKLSKEEKVLIASHVADFAMRMVLQGIAHDPEVMEAELDDFHAFFCRALEAAKRDARHDALIASSN